MVDFLDGTPEAVSEHCKEADPTELSIRGAHRWLVHGLEDDTVPPEFSRDYVAQKKKARESAELLELPDAGHFYLIDPSSKAFPQVRSTVLASLAAS